MPLPGIITAAPIAAKVGKAIAGLAGVDTQSPASHIAERSAAAADLMARAIAGDDAAWTQLWLASSRSLPVRSVNVVPRDEGKDCRPGACQSSGKIYTCAAGCTTQPFHGWPRVGDVLEDALRMVEQARGAPQAGQVSQTQAGMLAGFDSISGGALDSTNGFLGLSLIGAALFFAFHK